MGNKRIAIKLKPAAERMVKKRHPWVFEEGIVKQSHKGEAGDLAIVFDNKNNKFLACGLYDPFSPIRIKMLQFHESANIDNKWFEKKIKEAFVLRKPLFKRDTNSYRLIYGENDGLPGFICDVYANVSVIKLYSRIWIPYMDVILPIIIKTAKCESIVIRLSRNLQGPKHNLDYFDGQTIFGPVVEKVIFKEHGLNFTANVKEGHKTGFFLDHRHNRRMVGEQSKGKKVLDIFSYAGGFSVHALANGAKEVTSLDISQHALEMAKENVKLNSKKGAHKIMVADAFDGMNTLLSNKQFFDIVVIDPPSFAKKEKEISRALFSYKKLAILGAKLVKKGGLLVLASCSSRVSADDFFKTNLDALSKNHKLRLKGKTHHDIDHPINFPEGAYLKCGYYQL